MFRDDRVENPVDLAAEVQQLNIETHEIDEAENRLDELKYRKARAKTAFTKTRNQLLNLLDDEECLDRKLIKDTRRKLSDKQEEALQVIDALAIEYSSRTDKSALRKLTIEIEKLETEFSDAQQRVQVYLNNTLDDTSSFSSQKSAKEFEIGHVQFENKDSSYAFEHKLASEKQKTFVQGSLHLQGQYQSTPYQKPTNNFETNTFATIKSEPNMIGTDLWRQLKRVSIPVFSGDKRNYENWKATFTACIDQAPATPEYKLLQLRQYLSGEALRTVEKLGHSALAYEAAKERLDRKYGGTRRQVARYLEELENFRAIRSGNSKDLENFVDLLDVAVINLQDIGRNEELGNGSLYLKLQKKLTEQMISQYHRWIFEKKKQESVLSLREWAIQESEFQTIASETLQGLNMGSEKKPKWRDGNRTYFNRDGECRLCKGQHSVFECKQFKQMNLSDKWTFAKQSRLCYRCLGEGHIGSDCTKSRSCGVDGCTKTHNRLLHGQRNVDENQPKKLPRSERIPKSVSSATQTPLTTEGETLVTTERSHTIRDKSEISQRQEFLAMRTVPVVLINGNRRLKVNALLDDASTKTYINADVAAQLGLQGCVQKTNVNVLNGQVETFLTMPVEFTLESLDGKLNTTINAFTTEKVTGDMHVVNWNQYASKWNHLKDIQFPVIASKPLVDILLGLDYADLHYSVQDIRGERNEPIARLTPLGWTCIGVPQDDQLCQRANFNRTYLSRNDRHLDEVDTMLRQFWETEEVPSVDTPPWKMEDHLALKKVEQSLEYENGKYQVAIPWKKDETVVSNNYDMALRRLQNTERRLTKDAELAGVYSGIIEQYIKKGYIRKVQESEKRPTNAWYLPHFPVLRPDKPTTKTRIVFDASAKKNGVSLNDEIYQGPKLQKDLFNVLIRFRERPVALICDIAEMYLRIEIRKEDRPYQRFLWRSLEEDKIPDEYEFNRVVFGVNSSPFQAQFVVQQHAKSLENVYPMAAETVQESTYMDDSMDSVSTDDQAIELYRQLSELYEKADMYPHKWLSNSVAVLEKIPQEKRAMNVTLDRSSHWPGVKALGLQWLAGEDSFTFNEQPIGNELSLTKRNFLKKMATLFDPMGFLAPFVIQAKIILQEIWTRGLDWDEMLDGDLRSKAETWLKELESLAQVKVPRCIRLGQEEEVLSFTLHTFVDASQDAYGAVVYGKFVYQSGKQSCRLIAAKSRVAPLKAMSIPRLELTAAVLGARLTASIINALKLKPDQTTYWSDSMNVLWWIRNPSRMYQVFVANRVGEIQTLTNPNQWRYIPSEENLADLLTRGATISVLTSMNSWWNGPRFLEQDESMWPINRIQIQESANAERKNDSRKRERSKVGKEESIKIEATPERTMTAMGARTVQSWRLQPTLFSSWKRLTRIRCWVNRFISNCKATPYGRVVGELTPEEIRDTENEIIMQAQRETFASDIEALQREKELPKTSKLVGLYPRLHDDGLLRSNGRLQYAEFLPFDVRFPIILPRKHWVTKLLVKYYHELSNHVAGTNQVLVNMSSRFWIVSGREEIRDWEKECFECKRRNAKAATQIMAPLPNIRLKASLRAFCYAAVDYAGPFLTVQGRGKRRQKRYLCLFTCLSCRAVHLEIAFSMDTDSFLNAFYRMVNRRGLPEEIISDNGTNLVGAERELRQLVEQLNKNKIIASTANSGVKWHFNPPHAPHFGGVFETMIKSAKKAIYAILGSAEITDEELLSAFTGAESLMNSRPLTYQSANLKDSIPLTPNHFLYGQVGGQFAPESVDETDFNPRKRWRRVQELVRHFWHRWLREWIPSLNRRKKWKRLQKNVKEGDIVLVISPDSPRGHWPLGRIIKVYSGKDGHVRVVEVRVGENTYKRPITKICPLECELRENSDSPEL